ncbi:MAG: hypothetical protein V1921_06910 [Candidatus Altiarchaeota archaeon]
MNYGTMFFMFLIASSSASAWNIYTQEHICEKAVEQIWNTAVADNCLPRMNSKFIETICREVYEVKGPDYYNSCMNLVNDKTFLHPSEIPPTLFKDTTLHYDYSSCPAAPGPTLRMLCGNRDDHPASDLAEVWFKRAEQANEICLRVYDFCIGAHYYADSENPLNQMKNVRERDCKAPLMNMVDDRLRANDDNWQASKRCRFEGVEYEQTLSITDERITNIIAALYERGVNLSELSFKQQSKVVLLANSIDFDLGFNFYNYLLTRNVDIVRSTAEEFLAYQYSPYVIILGGQNAPEGVGEVVRTVLTNEEQENLIASPVNTIAAEKGDVWKLGQKVWVLAGYDRFLTQNVSESNRELVYKQIRA